jgi:hypothetical protein
MWLVAVAVIVIQRTMQAFIRSSVAVATAVLRSPDNFEL